jgi:hypothetical protein
MVTSMNILEKNDVRVCGQGEHPYFHKAGLFSGEFFSLNYGQKGDRFQKF